MKTSGSLIRIGFVPIAGLMPLAAIAADPIVPAKPRQPSIVGTWEWARKSNNCTEQHVYRSDGTVSIRGGDRLIESTYRMSWAPEPNGRYRLTITTLKDSGGRGCTDDAAASVGNESVVYVLFGQSHETMIQCGTPAGADCIGPLKRTAR